MWSFVAYSNVCVSRLFRVLLWEVLLSGWNVQIVSHILSATVDFNLTPIPVLVFSSCYLVHCDQCVCV